MRGVEQVGDTAAAEVKVRSCCRLQDRGGYVTLLSAKSEACLTNKEMVSWVESGGRTVAQTVRDDVRGIRGEQRGGLWKSVEKAVYSATLLALLTHPARGVGGPPICQESRG